MGQFDYNKAVIRLEEIATMVEDPAVGIDDISKLIKESDKIVEQCKEYLRSTRDLNLNNESQNL